MAEQKAKKAADAKSKIENQKPDKSPQIMHAMQDMTLNKNQVLGKPNQQPVISQRQPISQNVETEGQAPSNNFRAALNDYNAPPVANAVFVAKPMNY